LLGRVVLTTILTVATFLGAGQELAAKQDKKRVSDLLNRIQRNSKKSSIDIKKARISLPPVAKPDRKARSYNLEMIKPPSSFKNFVAAETGEAKLERLVDDEIDQLYQLTQKYRKTDRRGELWLRLAELYIEKARLIEFRKQEDFEKKVQAWLKRGQKGRKPTIDLAEPQKFNRKAIQLYEWYLRDFPKSKDADQALFFVGYNFFEIGDVKKGARYYEILTERFPKSVFITESFFALGEFYFENEQWAKALDNYQAVIQKKRSRVFSFALYKAAWCQYRLGKIENAISSLEKVIRFGQSEEEKSDSRFGKVSRVRLVNEALRDLVPIFGESRNYETAFRYFSSLVGAEKAWEMLERLAYVYSDKGRREEARYTFSLLLDRNPTAPKAFEYQYQIVQNYLGGGDRRVFRRELFRWIESYSNSSAWYQANKNDADLTKKSEDLREKTLREYVLQQHQTAQNSGSNVVRQIAKSGYILYLKNFSNTDKLFEMRFFFGELLYDLKEYELAGDQYKWVAANAKGSKYYEDSVLNQVLAYEKPLPKEEDVRRKAGDSLEPIGFGEKELAFIQAGDQYISEFPKGTKVEDITFKLGRLHYSYNHFDKAIVYFENVVKNHPKSQSAVYSANLILDIYNLRKDYESLARAGQTILKTPGLKTAEIQLDVQDVVEKASFKKGQELETSGKYAESAEAFEKFSLQHAKSTLLPAAIFNSAVNFERAGDNARALKMHSKFAALPDSKKGKLERQAFDLRIRLFELSGRFEEVAHELRGFIKANPKDPKAADYAFNAAVIYEALGQDSSAIQMFEKFYDLAPSAERPLALFRIAKMYQRGGKNFSAGKTYERYLKENPRDPDRVVEAHAMLARLNRKMGKTADSDRWYDLTELVYGRLKGRTNDISKEYFAEAQFSDVQRQFEEYRKLRIPRNPNTQAKVLKEKLAKLDALNRELAKVIKIDSPKYIVGALATLGLAYEDIAEQLIKAPLPSGLTAEEADLYRKEILKIGEPLQQKSIENFSSAIAKSQQLDSYSDFTAQAIGGLKRLGASKTPVFTGEIVDVPLPLILEI